MGLSAEDREALIDRFHFDCTDAGDGECDTTCHYLARHITEAVETIVARHVRAALTELETRCARAAGELLALSVTAAEALRDDEAVRLLGKRDGVRLAMSYLDEAVRNLSPDG